MEVAVVVAYRQSMAEVAAGEMWNGVHSQARAGTFHILGAVVVAVVGFPQRLGALVASKALPLGRWKCLARLLPP
tara:strand:+ start:509 stop:733 length:225 start_codon:yes stop_codon:yes gene_type:complete